MGMSIDEAILDLTALKICGVVPFTKGTISGGNYKVITEECINTAIETMCKYQKIKELIEPLKLLSMDEMSSIEYKILEIIEDGNDD